MATRAEIESTFPGLQREQFEISSPYDPQYNCIGFAAGDTSRWWWPNLGGYFWPLPVPPTPTVRDFVEAFALDGYSRTGSARFERNFEKIAIYADPATGDPTHAARQLANGRWTSKLGKHEDIWHTSTTGVEGAEYGRVAVIMKRRVRGVDWVAVLRSFLRAARRSVGQGSN